MPLQYPPKRVGPSLGLALDNQDIVHNYVQKYVTFTTKLDALTLRNKPIIGNILKLEIITVFTSA